MLVLEIFRQISICVPHKYYAIPFDAKFVFNDANFKVIHHQEFEVKNEPLRVAIDVQIKNQRFRKNILVGYSLSMRLIINDCICAEKEMVIGWMESLVWKKLRSKINKEIQYNGFNIKREYPLAVGRLNPENVIVGGCEMNNKQLTTTLCIDQTYFPIFDHQLDHVPAMFIIEAFRQSALLAIEKYANSSAKCNTRPLFFSNCNISFQHFCELNNFANCVISLNEIEYKNGFITFELLYSYMMEHVQGRRYHSNDGLIAKCLRNRAYSTPPINDEELTAILLGSLLGGDQNTLTVMTKIIYGLLSIPELWKKLHFEPKLIHSIIEEMLRLTNLGNASCFPRIATHDLELTTGNIPKGAAVYADVMLANRDPDVFPQPLRINPLRAFNQHLQFGYGMHNCMGQELVRLEINAVVSFLSHKYPNMKLSNEKLNCITWTEGIVLRRPNQLPVIF